MFNLYFGSKVTNLSDIIIIIVVAVVVGLKYFRHNTPQ